MYYKVLCSESIPSGGQHEFKFKSIGPQIQASFGPLMNNMVRIIKPFFIFCKFFLFHRSLPN